MPAAADKPNREDLEDVRGTGWYLPSSLHLINKVTNQLYFMLPSIQLLCQSAKKYV